MGRLSKKVALLGVLLAVPVGVLAAPAGETKAEKAARRAERQAAKAARAEKGKPPAKEPAKPVKRPVAPSATRPTVTGGAPLPACPPDNPLTYRSFGAGFLRTWCTGCHSSTLAAAERQDAPDDVNFDRAELYKPQARLVYERAVLEAHKIAADESAAASPMPPAGLVPEADRRRLAQWIACGSPGL